MTGLQTWQRGQIEALREHLQRLARRDRSGHGRVTTYREHGCRCAPCRLAWRRYRKDRAGAR